MGEFGTMADSKRLRTSERESENDEVGDGSGFAGAAIGAELAKNEAAATDALREGLEAFARKARDKTPAPQLKGFLFEYIEAAKFNQNAARAGSRARSQVTGAEEGGGHDVADIKVRGPSGKETQFQLKASDDAVALADKAMEPKYEGLEFQVPSDKRDEVNRILAERGVSRKVVGDMELDGVSSGGTTSQELKWATKNRKLYPLKWEFGQVGREALETGIKAAVAAAVIGGGLSAIRNFCSYMNGQVDGRTAVKNTAKDTVSSSARGGGAGALGSVIRYGAGRAGVQTLTKSNIASAVAAGAIEVGTTVYALAKGEITTDEAVERIGETGCATASGIYTGAAAGAIFGPAGAVVGSVVGYMATAWIYQSSLTVLKQARLAEDEAARLIALCAEATRAMDLQREMFEAQLAALLDRQDQTFRRCFSAIDEALATDEPDDCVRELACLTAMTGQALKFKGFDEFNEFMTESKAPLIL